MTRNTIHTLFVYVYERRHPRVTSYHALNSKLVNSEMTMEAEGVSLREFYLATNTVEDSLNFAIKHGLLPPRQGLRCSKCKNKTTVKWVPRASEAIPWRGRCSTSRCNKTYSVAKDTWFFNSHLSVSISLEIIYLWIMGTKVGDVAAQCHLSTNTVTDYYQFCREVCYVVVSNNSSPIGGAGHVVELDESHLFTRKYHRGRLTAPERYQQWIFGGIDRATKECFVVEVKKRDANTLVPLINQFVLPGTKVITDHWRSYRQLANEGFEHHFVNHSVAFVSASDPSVHTQNIERLWRSVKRVCKGEGRPSKRLDLYLFQFLYFHDLKVRLDITTKSQQFAHFLSDISRVYPGQFNNTRLHPQQYPKDDPNTSAVAN